MSFPKTLSTNVPDLKLIKPDIERDAVTSLHWLEGEDGTNTLQLMGVPKDKITTPSIKACPGSSILDTYQRDFFKLLV